MQSTHSYDAVVIGAGAGGMCTAARLAAAGKTVLLVDNKDRLGGRATSEVIDGFIINTGAIALEKGSTFEETFDLVGASLDVREPSPATVFYIDGKIVNITKGGWGMLLGTVTKQAAKIGQKFADARGGDLPEAKLSTEDWLMKYTKNKTVHTLFRNMCAAIFAANSSELPARAFLTYFTQKGAFKRFGFSPNGTIGAWNALGAAIEAKGGTIWLNADVQKINSTEGKATSVELTKGGTTHTIEAKVIISNAGPTATAAMVGEDTMGNDYLHQLKTVLRPAANIVINFATQERLIDAPGLITFTSTERVCNLGELTATCPEMAPEGWHLYVAYAVPNPAIGDFDEKAEIEMGLQDLRNLFPGFDDKARIISIRVMRDEWPAQRSCAGFDMPQETPLSNLWNVGDAVKDYGDGGTQACALTAKFATEQALNII